LVFNKLQIDIYIRHCRIYIWLLLVFIYAKIDIYIECWYTWYLSYISSVDILLEMVLSHEQIDIYIRHCRIYIWLLLVFIYAKIDIYIERWYTWYLSYISSVDVLLEMVLSHEQIDIYIRHCRIYMTVIGFYLCADWYLYWVLIYFILVIHIPCWYMASIGLKP
jgi:hypothetical protein